MRYVEPGMEIVEVEQNIFMLSSTEEGSGSGSTVEGGGGNWVQ